MSAVLRINVTGSNSVRLTIDYHEKKPEEVQPEEVTVPDLKALWKRASTWMSAHVTEQHALALTQQVADNAEMAYMSLVARKTLLSQTLASQKVTLAENLSARKAAVAEGLSSVSFAETLSSAKLAETLSGAKFVDSFASGKLVDTLASRKALFVEGLAAHKATMAEQTATLATGLATRKAALAEQTATLATGLATRKAALADVTNQVAKRTHERTQQMAAGLAARKATLAESASAQKASQLLGDAVETSATVLSKVQTAPIVRAVSDGAGAMATKVSGWANAALDESRAFAAMQQF